jgi:hypothetical protein
MTNINFKRFPKRVGYKSSRPQNIFVTSFPAAVEQGQKMMKDVKATTGTVETLNGTFCFETTFSAIEKCASCFSSTRYYAKDFSFEDEIGKVIARENGFDLDLLSNNITVKFFFVAEFCNKTENIDFQKLVKNNFRFPFPFEFNAKSETFSLKLYVVFATKKFDISSFYDGCVASV